MDYVSVREEVVGVARSLNELGLNRGTAGNVSARVAEGMLITPAAVAYEAMDPGDVVLMELDGEVLEGETRPSTEWRLHGAVLAARPEVGGVVHTHAPACTTLACLRRDIPAFHYMVAVAGGDSIRCASYETFGTPELAEAAVAALEGRTACLLSNHGMVALGENAALALGLAVEVESLAEIYLRALQVDEPATLTERQMQRVLDALESYRS